MVRRESTTIAEVDSQFLYNFSSNSSRLAIGPPPEVAPELPEFAPERSNSRRIFKAAALGSMALALFAGQPVLAQEQKPAKPSTTLPIPTMKYVGVVAPELMTSNFSDAKDYANQIKEAGFNSVKIAVRNIEGDFNRQTQTEFCNAAGAAQQANLNFVVTYYGWDKDSGVGWVPSTVDEAKRWGNTLVEYIDLLGGSVAGEKPGGTVRCSTLSEPMAHFAMEIGNEWNLALFAPNQENAPADFVATYFTIKPFLNQEEQKLGVNIDVWAAGLTPGHQPIEFIKKVGAVMTMRNIKVNMLFDVFDYHPFMPASDISPDRHNPDGNFIGLQEVSEIRDAGKKYLNFTGQVVSGEFGVQSKIPKEKLSLYEGPGPAASAVDQVTQGEFYRLAYIITNCQANNQGLFMFHFRDDAGATSTWRQSGIEYPNGDKKDSYGRVSETAKLAQEGRLVTRYECSKYNQTPTYLWSPQGLNTLTSFNDYHTTSTANPPKNLHNQAVQN